MTSDSVTRKKKNGPKKENGENESTLRLEIKSGRQKGGTFSAVSICHKVSRMRLRCLGNAHTLLTEKRVYPLSTCQGGVLEPAANGRL